MRGSCDPGACVWGAACARGGLEQFSYTPLHSASYNGHSSVVPLLLAAGADPDQEEWSDRPHLARERNRSQVVQLLQVSTRALRRHAAVGGEGGSGGGSDAEGRGETRARGAGEKQVAAARESAAVGRSGGGAGPGRARASVGKEGVRGWGNRRGAERRPARGSSPGRGRGWEGGHGAGRGKRTAEGRASKGRRERACLRRIGPPVPARPPLSAAVLGPP